MHFCVLSIFSFHSWTFPFAICYLCLIFDDNTLLVSRLGFSSSIRFILEQKLKIEKPKILKLKICKNENKQIVIQ
jgi:hypothetical protein